MAAPNGKRERFADRRRARYDKAGLGHATAVVAAATEHPCIACGRGRGVEVATIGGRVVHECDYCSRRFFVAKGPRP